MFLLIRIDNDKTAEFVENARWGEIQVKSITQNTYCKMSLKAKIIASIPVNSVCCRQPSVRWLLVPAIIAAVCFANTSHGKTPAVSDALQLKPLQKNIEFDLPTGKSLEKCKVESASNIGQSGWIVWDENGRLLRRFVDTKKDGQIDQWCYYKDGIEVYRDIDADGDNEAETFVWMGPAGIRRGKDNDGDAAIDEWERISAEEVSSELVKALSTADKNHFASLLPTEKEIDSLKLGKLMTSELKKQVENAKAEFAKRGGKTLKRGARWQHFGGTRPTLIAEGTLDSVSDLVTYENVVALVDDGGDSAQLAVGTLIKIGDSWRAIDMPERLESGKAPSVGGFFTDLILANTGMPRGARGGEVSQKMQQLIADFQVVEETLSGEGAAKLSKKELVKLNAQRADIIEELFNETEAKNEKSNWAVQLVETVTTAYRQGQFPDGLGRIEKFLASVEKGKELDKKQFGDIKYRLMDIVHNEQVLDEDLDATKVQKKWKEDLEEFVDEYDTSTSAAVAMLELGLLGEFEAANETDDEKSAELDEAAEEWYQKIVKNHPDSSVAKKAAGAIRRINSVGNRVNLQGKTLDGKALSVADAKGKIVVLHYWATYCNLCVQEMEMIDKLMEKYGSRGLQPIGVNLDSDMKQLGTFMKKSGPDWPQLHSKGGVESELAVELGVLVLPTMFLIDRDGKVVNRRLSGNDLEDAIKELLKKKE